MKRFWLIIAAIIIVLGGSLFVVFDLTDEQNKLARQLDYKPIKDFYSIKDMPLKFHDERGPNVFGDYLGGRNQERIYQSWRNGEKKINSIQLVTTFSYYNDLTYTDVYYDNGIGRIFPVTVKGQEGYYGYYGNNNNYTDSSEFTLTEYISVIINGVFYELSISHTNLDVFGQEYLVDFVNKYLVN